MTLDLRTAPALALGPSAAERISDPRVVLLAGAAVTSVTGILIKVAGESAATTTMFRCGLALPILALLAWREFRRHGRMSRRAVAAHLFGGAVLGADFAMWARSIEMIGAGIATVVANFQVVVVPLLAWLVFRARIPLRFVVALPFLFAGVALAGGALGGDGEAVHLALGVAFALAAGVAYGVYIFVAGRAGTPQRAGTQVFLGTAAAGVVGTAVGALWGPVDPTPGWPAFGWLALLAVTGQVVGWLLIGYALPRLASEVGATLLLMQPVLAVMLSILLVGERLAVAQFAGCGLVIVAVWAVSRASSRPAVGDDEQPADDSDVDELRRRAEDREVERKVSEHDCLQPCRA
ncbi:MAG TPA: DMT family transporter [Aldersonia sp.]